MHCFPPGLDIWLPTISEFVDGPLVLAQLIGCLLSAVILVFLRSVRSVAAQFEWFKEGAKDEMISALINFGSIWFATCLFATSWEQRIFRIFLGAICYGFAFRHRLRKNKAEKQA